MKSKGVRLPRCWAAGLLAGLLLSSWVGRTQTAKPTEYQVKAAYLARFVKFIESPASGADEPFAICVLGPDPFGPALDAAVNGESVDRHPLVARRVAGVREASTCRVLFMGGDEGEVRRAIAALDKAGVLTVSDLPQFLKRGGMIQFVLEGNRVRFEVNLAAAKKAGLTLSSELLKVAAAVRREP